ncbi:hypothetical protein ACWELQ_46225, partial [Nocardia sp. NPDC004722]
LAVDGVGEFRQGVVRAGAQAPGQCIGVGERGRAPAAALRTIGFPPELKARPESGYHAAFSGPYTVAAALIGGGGLGVFHEDFTDAAARDPRRLALAARVRCTPDPRSDEIFPHQFPAVLTARLHDGRTLTERVEANRGGPGNPLSADELALKFRLNTAGILSPATANTLSAITYDLATAADLERLLHPLRTLRARRPDPLEDSDGSH